MPPEMWDPAREFYDMLLIVSYQMLYFDGESKRPWRLYIIFLE
jgi:hypothetical protein